MPPPSAGHPPVQSSNNGQRRWLIASAGVFVAIAVIVAARSGEPPAAGPRTSNELLTEIFRTTGRVIVNPVRSLGKTGMRLSLASFVRAADLSDEACEERLVRHIQGGEVQQTTIPFLFYLRELYGEALEGGKEASDLAYDPPPTREAGGDHREGADMLAKSRTLRRHLGTILRLYDALFLQVKPDVSDSAPLHERYETAAYLEVKQVIAVAFGKLVRPESDDALSHEDPKDEYKVALGAILDDDQRLSDLAEFLTNMVRDLARGWLDSWAARQHRHTLRRQWVEEMIAAGRYDVIADWAAARSQRRLAVHVVVDGLGGLLLEGLARLSSGDAEHHASQYLRDLVARYRQPRFDPASYGSSLPPALGSDIQELADRPHRQPGFLANFKRHFFADEAPSVVTHVASVDTPAISVRNLPLVFSGHSVAGPWGTGIPNFSYLDRTSDRGWYFWGSDVLHLARIFGNRENEIPRGVPRPGPGARMLAERLPHLSTMTVAAAIDTGAQEKLFGQLAIAVGEIQRDLVEKLTVLRLRRKAEMEVKLQKHRQVLVASRDLRWTLLGALVTQAGDLARFHTAARFVADHEDDGLPDYLLWYNPWPDHFAHYTGPFADAIVGVRGEYDRLDFWLGKILDVYASVEASPQGSLLDQTLVGVTSDHGLVYTPMLVSTDELLFKALEREGKTISFLKLTHDEGGLPAIHSDRRHEPTRPFDAIVGSTAGGSYIVDLFHQEPERWTQHPGYHDLRALPLLAGGTLDWIDAVRRLLGDHLDLAVVREYGPAPDQPWSEDLQVQSAVRVFSSRGEARITRLSSGRIRYQVLSENDPLALEAAVRPWLISPGGPNPQEARSRIREALANSTGHTEQEWLEMLSTTQRPDVVPQLVRLYDSARAGTLNIFPALHVGMNSGVPGRHAGEAFEEKNGVLLLRAPGLGPSARIQTARCGSLPVTIYEWLDGSDMEGFGHRSLLQQPALKPLDQVGLGPTHQMGDSEE